MSIGLVIVGVDYCTAPACLVERIRDRDDCLRQAVAELRGHSCIVAAFLITLSDHCEVIVWASDPVAASSAVLNTLTTVAGLRAEDWSAFHRHVDEEALAHLMSAIAAADGGQAAAQLQLCCEQSPRSGMVSHMLRDVAQYAKVHASTAANGPASNLSPRSAARHLWMQLQAQACLPESAKIRNEVDTICAEEIDIFRRRCGGLMTEEQERAVKIVTARISERVGEWIIRAWSDSAASPQQPSGRRSS